MPPSALPTHRKCSRHHSADSIFLLVLLPFFLQQCNCAHEALTQRDSGPILPRIATNPEPAGRSQPCWHLSNDTHGLHEALAGSMDGEVQVMPMSGGAHAPAQRHELPNSSGHPQASITMPKPRFRLLLKGISQRPAMPAHTKVTGAVLTGSHLQHQQSQAFLQSSAGNALTAVTRRSLLDDTAQVGSRAQLLPSATSQQYIFVMKVRAHAGSSCKLRRKQHCPHMRELMPLGL